MRLWVVRRACLPIYREFAQVEMVLNSSLFHLGEGTEVRGMRK
jgi:hypothetical protein